jgi:GTPase SAR1 family protein
MASTKVPEQKVILCGEYGVGKSSLFRRYANDTFVTSTDRQSTLGLDHFERQYRVNDKLIKVIKFNSEYSCYICNNFMNNYTAPVMGHWWNGKSGFDYFKLL